MRKMFRGYYHPTEDEFSELWENGIFIFDANILLNIYRYSESTRDLFLKILEKLSDRTIIPHQAAKEYQNNRLKVIRDQKKAYNDINDYLNSELERIRNELNSYKRHPSINKENILKDIEIVFNSIIDDLKEQDAEHPNFFENDELRDKLTVLLDGKISKPCPEDSMDEIWKDGKERYRKKIPPGYKDKKDKEGFKKCGDLILWYQIIDIAKKKNKPIILVTDDKKEDWWWKSGGKTIGPRPELVEEIYNEADVLFYMYKTDNFIKYAEKEFFNVDTDPSVIKEVKDAMSKIDHPIKDVTFQESDNWDKVYSLFNTIFSDAKKDLSDQRLKEALKARKEELDELRTSLKYKNRLMFLLDETIMNTSSDDKLSKLKAQRKILTYEINDLNNEIEKLENTCRSYEVLLTKYG